MDAETKRRIDVLADQDDRTRSNMLAWLVNQEFARRGMSVSTSTNTENNEMRSEAAKNEVDKSKS